MGCHEPTPKRRGPRSKTSVMSDSDDDFMPDPRAARTLAAGGGAGQSAAGAGSRDLTLDIPETNGGVQGSKRKRVTSDAADGDTSGAGSSALHAAADGDTSGAGSSALHDAADGDTSGAGSSALHAAAVEPRGADWEDSALQKVLRDPRCKHVTLHQGGLLNLADTCLLSRDASVCKWMTNVGEGARAEAGASWMKAAPHCTGQLSSADGEGEKCSRCRMFGAHVQWLAEHFMVCQNGVINATMLCGTAGETRETHRSRGGSDPVMPLSLGDLHKCWRVEYVQKVECQTHTIAGQGPVSLSLLGPHGKLNSAEVRRLASPDVAALRVAVCDVDEDTTIHHALVQ